MLHENVFTGPDVAAIADVSLPTIDAWEKQGVVRASIRPKGGRGVERLFDFEDVFCASVAQKLRQAGVPIELVKKATSCIYEGTAEGGLRVLVIADGEAKRTSLADARALVGRGVSSVLTIDLPTNIVRLREEIDRQIAERKRQLVSMN